ncbi:MAG: Gfo/Idh/MocA family oxidoreductase [Acidobacteria bacterium]|nr:Gfo/Idh/MocA family oxidoreductase [Acidobacteriota bacterium]
MGLIGPGFIAEHHLDAVRRLEGVEIVGIAGSSPQSGRDRARVLGVRQAFDSYHDLLAEQQIDVVHNTTPSHLHYEISLAALRAGKHVISDKPLASTAWQCEELCEAAASAGVVAAVTFNYRGYAAVQQARTMAHGDELGQQVYIHGHYLQDWMADDHVFSWRIDPVCAGESAALIDVGAHWCDLAEYLSGSRISQVLADLHTAIPIRFSSGTSQTFAGPARDHGTPVEVHCEDLASLLLKFENGARGCLKVAQVLPGHKNDLQIEVCGRAASVRWEQEKPNELWIGYANAPNAVMSMQASLLAPQARAYASLPAGHPAGWPDAFRAVVSDIYDWIRADRTATRQPATLCTFEDAHRISVIIESMLESHKRGGVWIDVPQKNLEGTREIVAAAGGERR